MVCCKLLIEHDAVGHDDNAVEDPLSSAAIMQAGEPVREPADGVALAAAGGVLDQIVVANPIY
jgi:hypothetical protein